MPLTSPRFKNEKPIERIDHGQALMSKGSKGHHVHLVQMALLDLGYKMPISTRSQSYSPDGIFGDETKATVKEFQTATGFLEPDGIIGQQTIRELDRLIGGFKHSIGVHFRSIALTKVPFNTILASTKQVYAQYGIRIDMMNGESLALSAADQARFEKINQLCVWDLTLGEFNELHSLGTPAPATDVLVYFIHSFKKEPAATGCGGHAKGRPACTVAITGNRWSLAHEMGHVLLGSGFTPVHTNDTRSVMYKKAAYRASTPTLTEKQLAVIRASTVCKTL